MTAKKEKHADPHATGAQTLSYMKSEFDMNGRETVALMGAHTVGRLHVIHSLLRYTWKARSSGLFNNGYYRNMAKRADWYYDSALNDKPCAQGAVGNSSGQRPIARWLPHVRGDTNLGGPMQWIQQKFVCPTCSLLDKSSDKYQSCCAGVPAGACKPGCEAWRFVVGLDETALSAEMGFYFKFQVNSTNGIAYGCPGFENFNAEKWGLVPGVGLKNYQWTWTTAQINGVWTNAEPQCMLNTDVDPPGDIPLHKIVEQYADDQTAWVADFFPVLEKMLANGYSDADLSSAPAAGMTGFVYKSQDRQDTNRFYSCVAHTTTLAPTMASTTPTPIVATTKTSMVETETIGDIASAATQTTSSMLIAAIVASSTTIQQHRWLR